MSSGRDYQLESCVISYEQAIAAVEHGSDRLELCSRLETEGMTPDILLAADIINHVHVPVRIMIRETEEGFESDALILEKMKLAIERFKSIPIDGFVIGLLKNNRIDRDAMRQLVECCSPFPITIHKALDLSLDVDDDIRWLNQFPSVDTILTSGGKTSATDGIEQILRMKTEFTGMIMGAGKITQHLLPELHEELQLKWYHGRKLV